MQPALIFVQPVAGFHVASVNLMCEFATVRSCYKFPHIEPLMTKRRHHYIPQFYLRNFCDPNGSGKVWIYTKKGARLTAASPRDVGVEKDYHTITSQTGEKDRLTIENTFAELENAAAPVLRKICSGKALIFQEHEVFVVFVGQMLLRVPVRRDEAGQMMNSIFKHFATDWASDSNSYQADYRRFQVETHNTSDIDPEEVRQFVLSRAYNFEIDPSMALAASIASLGAVTKYLTRLNWLFLKARGRFEFVSCDNPVFYCDPTASPGTWRGVGLSNLGIEVSFPISPSVLAFGSYRSQRSGEVQAKPEVVRFLNQRTIDSAYRYIYAARGSSAVARFISRNGDNNLPVQSYIR